MAIGKLRLAAAIGFGAASLPSMATRYVPCDGCTVTQMQQVAVSSGVGVVDVGDIYTDHIVTYRVYVDKPSRNISGQGMVPETPVLTDAIIPTAAEDLSAFAALRSFHHAPPTGYEKSYNLHIVASDPTLAVPDRWKHSVGGRSGAPAATAVGETYSSQSEPAPGVAYVTYPTPGVDVYDVINSGPAQNQFLSWFSKQSAVGLSNSMSNAVRAASVLHITDPSAVPVVSATITFQDGSHIGAYLDTSQSPAQVVINPKSGVDSHGNNVPASLDTTAGAGRQIYDYRGDGNKADLGRMRQQLGSFGLMVPQLTEWACTNTGTQNEVVIHCVPVGGG